MFRNKSSVPNKEKPVDSEDDEEETSPEGQDNKEIADVGYWRPFGHRPPGPKRTEVCRLGDGL